MSAKKAKAPKVRDKDLLEMMRVLAALKGAEHNPVNWAAVIALVAPIIARLAARYAAGLLAAQWNKRATPKIRKAVAEDTADRIVSIFQKQKS